MPLHGRLGTRPSNSFENLRSSKFFFDVSVSYFRFAVCSRMLCSGWRYVCSENSEKAFAELAYEESISIRHKFLKKSMIWVAVVFE